MAPPQMKLMQPGQDGLSAAWQRGSINNQPPNAGMHNSKFARSEGPSGFPSWDPMIMQQWQAQRLIHKSLSQQMMHMHIIIEMLQEENWTHNFYIMPKRATT